MKILDFLKEENVIVGNIDQQGKDKILEEVIKTLNFKNKHLHEKVISGLLERESVSSTAIGWELAIPHARIKGLEDIHLGVYILKKGIDFDALDKKPVRAFFVFISPHDDVKFHLRFLARLSRILRNKELRQRIIESEKSIQVILAIEEFEKDHMG